jgi:hypothetical protein
MPSSDFWASILAKEAMLGLGMEARPTHTSRTRMRKTAKAILSRRLFMFLIGLYKGKGAINRERGAMKRNIIIKCP